MTDKKNNKVPYVAVIGRPNVGKSTFINRITHKNDAIVHQSSGVTRDRSYYIADWCGQSFKLIDTGGIEISSDDEFQKNITMQANLAINECDIIIFICDSTTGISIEDEKIANKLHKTNKPVFLVANKCDDPNNLENIWEFYNLGFEEVYPISSLHGHGTGDLLDKVVDNFKHIESSSDTNSDNNSIDVAIIGRPNAGKSSLTNAMCGYNRSIVSDVSGTTRDSIDTIILRKDRAYNIIDTAGLRKKSSVKSSIEYYSFIRALKAIDRADIAVLVIDATIGLTDQDQKIANMAKEKGCGLVIALNKWDKIDSVEVKENIRTHMKERMEFVGYAKCVLTVASTGKKLKNVWESIDEAFNNYTKKISTSKLNNWLSEIKQKGFTVNKGKRTLRLNYVTQTGTMPPRFTFFVNHSSLVNDNFRRFLENRMREAFDFSGTPVILKFKNKN